MQPLQIAYGTGTLPSLTGTTCPTHANIMHLLYDFHSSSSTDNGNVWVINNCKDTNRTQNFVYDPLNRIWQAYTNGPNWGETFSPVSYSPGTSFSAASAGIDAWGNLTNRSGVTGKTNTEPLNAAPASIKNQLNGFCNDAAGNLVLNSGCPTGTFTPTYSYDIENRLTSPAAGYSYIYDGDGQRVKKCSNAGCTTGTLYWRGIGSDPLSESSVAGTINEEYIFFNGTRVARQDVSGCSTNCVHYYFSDHLGSADVITSSAGAIQKEADYYPYGGELVVSGSDINNYKFTGKERDSESGLDMFGARYYGSSLGRFTTPDWSAKAIGIPYADFADPQTLNLYGYVRNSPLKSADTDGHAPPDIAVIEDGPTQGNPIGHTAIAITGRGIFSFGTAEKDGSLTKLGGSTTDFLRNQAERRDQTITIIKTTPEQDKAAADALMKQDTKGSINIYPDNCSARSNAGLDAAGIPPAKTGNPITPMPADPAMPGTAGARAMDTSGSQTIVIPKGGTVPSQMNQFNPAPSAPPPKPQDTKPQQPSS